MSFDPDRLDARDARLIVRALPIARAYTEKYVRLRAKGLPHLAAARTGPALIVANHNGGIFGPDLIATLATLWTELGPERPVHMLAHDFAMRQATPLGRVLQKLGAIRAAPENLERALDAGAAVLVYPGGDLDAYRHARKKNEVVFGRRTGFVKIAQRMGVPVIPLVVAGAHGSAYVFHEGEGIARALGMKRWGRLERFPLALALPWGIALGPWTPYLPLPRRLSMAVLPPRTLDSGTDPAEARESIRAEMEQTLQALSR